MKEFQELQKEMNNLEKSYPVEFEGPIKKLTTIVYDNTYCWFNVSRKILLKGYQRRKG